jgi:hypothetical protein
MRTDKKAAMLCDRWQRCGPLLLASRPTVRFVVNAQVFSVLLATACMPENGLGS